MLILQQRKRIIMNYKEQLLEIKRLAKSIELI